MSMHSLLILTSISCVGFALLSLAWMFVPAPSYYVWLFTVGVSEWSLWLGALALAGTILALLDYAFYQPGKIAAATIIVGSCALLLSLYPLFSVLQAAREKGVSLSLGGYLSGLTAAESNSRFETHVYKRGEGVELKMDVYKPPAQVAGNGAGVVVIHGGAWSAGVRSDFPKWNEWLAANGFTVFDIDYTLAPQPNYLSAIGDVKCAVREIKRRGAEFGIQPGKIVLLGRSAGGYLALIAAYSANDLKLPSTCAESHSDNDETVRAVVSFYAPTDLIWAYYHPANQRVIDGPQMISNFIGGSPRESADIDSRYILALLTERVNANTPPTLLIHGGRDQVVRRENLDLLGETLKQNNRTIETLVIPYAEHGFDYNFNGWGSQIAKPLILDFLIKNTQN